MPDFTMSDKSYDNFADLSNIDFGQLNDVDQID